MAMNSRIRIELNARDEFWRKAVFVEWEDQYPERRLNFEANGDYLMIEGPWLDDLRRIAADCFSEVVVAPANPGRRIWLSRFMPSRREHKTR